MREKIIRRAVTVQPGEKYSDAALDASRRNLFDLNVFKSAAVHTGEPVYENNTVLGRRSGDAPGKTEREAGAGGMARTTACAAAGGLDIPEPDSTGGPVDISGPTLGYSGKHLR